MDRASRFDSPIALCGRVAFDVAVMVERDRLAARLQRLAAQGVFFGTSSWKYPGWCGTIYDRSRYEWRGRFALSRFERNCLAEYARTFPAVSLDASYYQFFRTAQIEELAAQVPAGFLFAAKVCGEITLKRFPQLPRFGPRAGQANPHFLDAGLFCDAFLAPWEPVRDKVGLFMFEFSRFGPDQFARGAEFVEALEAFLGKLPRGWPYGVELRNRHWLRPEYFAALARHGVTHIFNAWTDMPPVEEQMALADSQTNPSLLAARFLLRPGRAYEEAVRRFQPYAEVKDPNPAGRAAAAQLAQRGLKSAGRTQVLVFVNNRYEGNAPATIQAIVDQVEALGGPPTESPGARRQTD